MPFTETRLGRILRAAAACIMWVALLLPLVTVKACGQEQWYDFSTVEVLRGGGDGTPRNGEQATQADRPRAPDAPNFLLAFPFLVALWLNVRRKANSTDPLHVPFRAALALGVTIAAAFAMMLGALAPFLLDTTEPLAGMAVLTIGLAAFALLFGSEMIRGWWVSRKLDPMPPEGPQPGGKLALSVAATLIIATLVGGVGFIIWAVLPDGSSGEGSKPLTAIPGLVALSIVWLPHAFAGLALAKAAKAGRVWIRRGAWELVATLGSYAVVLMLQYLVTP